VTGEAEPVADPRPPSPPARLVAWVAVRLSFLVVPAFIALAVWAGLHTNAFESGGPVLNLIPADSPALRAQQDSLKLFGAPAGSDVIAVQRNPDGLSADVQKRIADRAASCSPCRWSTSPVRPLRVAT
jgi:hypothetical protein